MNRTFLLSAVASFVTSLCLSSTTLATADHCITRRNISCAPTYSSNTYAAQEYVAPVVATPQYVTQNFFYEVGPEVRYPAVAPQNVVLAQMGQLTREAQRIQDQMNDLKQYAQPQQQQAMAYCVPIQCVPIQQGAQPAGAPAAQPGAPAMPPPAQPQQPPVGQNPTFSMTQKSILQAKCMECHSKNPKANQMVDFTKPISCEQKLDAISQIINGTMPKGGRPLSPDEASDLINELTNQKAAPEQAPPAPADYGQRGKPGVTVAGYQFDKSNTGKQLSREEVLSRVADLLIQK